MPNETQARSLTGNISRKSKIGRPGWLEADTFRTAEAAVATKRLG